LEKMLFIKFWKDFLDFFYSFNSDKSERFAVKTKHLF